MRFRRAIPGRLTRYSANGEERSGVASSWWSDPTMEGEPTMSDYRNMNFDFRDPDDPFRNDSKLDPNVRTANAAWGWIAAAVFLVIVLAAAFGFGHRPGQGGTNMASNMTPPAPSRVAPTTVLPPAATPAPAANPAPPIAPAPAMPAQNNDTR